MLSEAADDDDAWPLDSDADGFRDSAEGVADADHDGLPDFLDYQGPFVGGGCGGAWAEGSGGAAGLLFLGLLGVRRRGAPARPSPRAAGLPVWIGKE